jgi:outer membrane biogenesis lipoprotein LolB
LIILIGLMKKLRVFALIASACVVLLAGCAGQGPSPEQQTREADQQREAERQQAEFRKGLPPVANPGQGQ